ncbi:MAG: FG-GAP repeat protein [Salinibacter sp.]
MRLLWPLCVGVVLVLFGGAPAHAQIEELPRPTGADTTTFGVSVALDDSVAVVGASGEHSCGVNAGAVYVYERAPARVSAWRNTARLVPDDCRGNMFFGEEVALDDERLLVGASSEYFAKEESNAAYVFERDTTGGWRQMARLTGETGRREGLFAAGLDLQGHRAVVSTSGSPQGEYSGAVYVFERDSTSGEWRRTARVPSPRGADAGVMGHDVKLDGDHLAVAASTFFRQAPGSVFIFRFDQSAGEWRPSARLPDIDAFFIDLALNDGTLAVGEERAGSEGTGRVTVWESTDSTWTQAAMLRPAAPYESGAFGTTVSLQGDRLLASGYDEQLGKDFNIDRVVYAFERVDGTWRERPIIDVGDVAFGAALDQDDGVALISSVPETRAGTVYVIRLP